MIVWFCPKLVVTGILLAICSRALAANPTAPELRAMRSGARIDVMIGDEFFTSYRFSADEKYPFLFPVNGPSGASVTSIRNGKYPHHSSLFFGCDKLNGGNYWQDSLDTGQIVSQGAVVHTDKGPQVVITDVCDWRRPNAEQPLRDTRRITISAPERNIRQIDFEVVLEALTDVSIAKTNHSFFSVRMDPDLAPAQGGTLRDAEGRAGEKETFGQAAGWMMCFGERAPGVIEGLAVLQHPANRWAPAPWFTRDYGFLSPTPMYWPADGKATRLAKGEKVLMRYRVLVFGGEPSALGVPGRFADYAARAAP